MSDQRELPIVLAWDAGGSICRITVGGRYWAAVEWSETRQAWCIEDAEGKCLAHASHIRGQVGSKKAAVALARAMIRDGRIPSPDQLAKEAAARRAKRRKQPSQIRKREERRQRNAAWMAAFSAQYEAERVDKAELPLLEALAEAFDFTDPDLWRSNSWAMIRPRLIVHQRAVVARLESELSSAIRHAEAQAGADRRHYGAIAVREITAKLDRAREIQCALDDDPRAQRRGDGDAAVDAVRGPVQ